MSVFQITVPTNTQPGDIINVSLPNGKEVKVKIPPGAMPGITITIDLTSAALQSQEKDLPRVNSLRKVIIPYNLGIERKMAVPRSDIQGDVAVIQVPPGIPEGTEVIVDILANQVVKTTRIQVEIPHGISAGELLAITLPSGHELTVEVPQGALVGDGLLLDTISGAILRHIGAPGSNLPVATPTFESQYITETGYPNWFTFLVQPIKRLPLQSFPVKWSLPPLPSGRKKALLIGINYTGTKAQLRGCINDVKRIQDFLLRQGFQNTPETMVVLVDNITNPQFMPTKANIERGIQWLVSNVAPGDTLFFHFSGHGAQEKDESGREVDGVNETICPSDFNKPKNGGGMISDDQLWDMLCAPLPSGCRLFALMDCCHSGTGLDLSFNYMKSTWKTDPNPNYSIGDVIMISGCRDNQISADTWAHDLNAAGGALTTSFVNTLQRKPDVTFYGFMESLKQDIKQRGFSQIPQLSASQMWEPKQRRVSFHDEIMGNNNDLWGKLKNQHFKPQTPNFSNSPIGPMLLAAGLIALHGPLVTEAGGELLGQVGHIAEGLEDVVESIGDSFLDTYDSIF